MKGFNQLRLNEATMIEALQHWLVTRVLDPNTTVRVTDVSWDGGSRDFVVKLCSPVEDKS